MSTWKTQDGRLVDMRDMTTNHIRNCIAMIERQLASRPDEYMWGEPDVDSDAYDAFMAEIAYNDHLEWALVKKKNEFETELEMRGLTA